MLWRHRRHMDFLVRRMRVIVSPVSKTCQLFKTWFIWTARIIWTIKFRLSVIDILQFFLRNQKYFLKYCQIYSNFQSSQWYTINACLDIGSNYCLIHNFLFKVTSIWTTKIFLKNKLKYLTCDLTLVYVWWNRQ